MNSFEIFRSGAMALAAANGDFAYTDTHAQYGVTKAAWAILRSPKPWTAPERSQMKVAIPEILNIAFTISGMPAKAIPAEYIAAVLAVVVAPSNILIAAQICPLGYDTAMASGLQGISKVEDVTRERMTALCLAYLGDYRAAPAEQTEETSA